MKPKRKVDAQRYCDWVLSAAIVGTAALFFGQGYLRWVNVHNETFDLAFYARIAWGMVHGQFYEPIVGAPFWGLHLSWILLPAGVLGLALGTVPVLLAMQALALALAAWPIARVGARLAGPFAGLTAGLAFLLYPNLSHVASFEFHPGSVAVLPLAVALDALHARHVRRFVWASLAVIACREDLAANVVLLALLYAFIDPDNRHAALGLAAGAALYLAIFVGVLLPLFAPKAGSVQAHFGGWGRSPADALQNLLNPRKLWAHLSHPERSFYLLRIVLPFALLPLLAPELLLTTMPVVALNLLSTFPRMTRFDSHYLTPVVPILAVAAIIGSSRLSRALNWVIRFRWFRQESVPLLCTIVLASSAAAHVRFAGTPCAAEFDAGAFSEDDYTQDARAILAKIPSNASVQAPMALLPHLAERPLLGREPPRELHTDFVVLNTAPRRRWGGEGTVLRTQQEPVLRRWLSRPELGVTSVHGPLVLLRRGESPRSVLGRYAYHPTEDELTRAQPLTACLRVLDAALQLPQAERTEEEQPALTFHFTATEPCPADLAVRFGVSDLPDRTELLADGLISPVHLRPDDTFATTYLLTPLEAARIKAHGLRVGALRASGARPNPADPNVVAVRVVIDPPAPSP